MKKGTKKVIAEKKINEADTVKEVKVETVLKAESDVETKTKSVKKEDATPEAKENTNAFKGFAVSPAVTTESEKPAEVKVENIPAEIRKDESILPDLNKHADVAVSRSGSIPKTDGLIEVKNFKSDTTQKLFFYELAENGVVETDGTTVETLLMVCKDRLTKLNIKHSCVENSSAIKSIEDALLWLNQRTRDRILRGVEGKHLD
jgi:hypothetical protein